MTLQQIKRTQGFLFVGIYSYAGVCLDTGMISYHMAKLNLALKGLELDLFPEGVGRVFIRKKWKKEKSET